MWMFPNSYDNCLLGGVLVIDKIKFVKNHWEHPDGTPIDYEKAIQEKAKQKFEDNVEDFCRGLNQKPFLEEYLNLPYENGYDYYKIDDLNNPYARQTRDRFMKMIFKDYDKLKSETISKYEQQMTDRLLDDMSGLRKFLED